MTKKCAHTDYERRVDESYNGCILCDNEILRGNLSLAEEGLASAMQEIGVLREELRKAVTGEICESCFEKGVADGTIRPRGSLEPLEQRAPAQELPLPPPRNHAFADLEGKEPDINLWNAESMDAYGQQCYNIGFAKGYFDRTPPANLASRDAKSETAK